ncbi:putative holin, partial [Aeromonas caviae]
KIAGRVILLFITSFICGLLAADVTVQMLTKLLPVGIEINKGVGAIVAAALAVKILKVAMNAIPGQLGTLFSRIGKGGNDDPH